MPAPVSEMVRCSPSSFVPVTDPRNVNDVDTAPLPIRIDNKAI
jgi:hypothetical protein